MYGIYDGGAVIAQFVAPMTVRSNQPVFVADTLSLKRSTKKRGAQRWEIETHLMPLVHTANELFVDLITKGHTAPTQIITPQNYGVIKRRTSNSPSVTATGNKHASIITIASNSGLIPKGTFIRFSVNSKVYITTEDITGNGQVGIYPALQADLSASSMTHQDDVIMNCYYDLDVLSGMVYTDGIVMDSGAVKLVEAL